jgi:AcrR family transcriptional regulator
VASRAVSKGDLGTSRPADGKARAAARGVVRRYDPSETRTRVLEAAYMLFGTRGYANTGTADIAREADVSEGSIFYHFGSKRALLAELGRMHGEKLITAMQGGDALESVSFELSINRCFDFCEINNVWDEVVEQGDCSKPKVDKHDPEAEPFFHATREVVVDWTRRHLEAVRHRGDPCIDTEIAASFIFSLVGDALTRYFSAETTPAQKLRIRAETVRFCTAAAGQPTGCGFNL